MADDNNKQDPIERLFGKKVWDYDISYNEADWMELEDRLDILDKQHANTNKRRWITAAAILLFSLLSFFTYQNYTQIKQISQLLNSEDTAEKVQQDRSNDEPASPKDKQPGTEEESTAVAADEDQSSNRPGNDTQKNSSGEQVPPLLDSEFAGQRENNETVNQGSGIFSLSSKTAQALFVAELSCSACDLSRPAVEGRPLVFAGTEASRKENSDAGVPPLADNNDPSDTIHSGKNTFEQIASRFSIGLVAGPDLSTVGSISDFRTPGYKVGLKVEYNITPNLAITTGIVESEVQYTARGGEYKPPYGFWTNGIAASETAATCMLLDIPISLKYDFLQFSGSRFFATAGLSSYIMLDETYSFNYDSQETGLVQGWSGKTGTRHWFSNAGFSIGYEFDVHPKWSLRAEPFIKIPISEVGWGNVNLYSMGSFISLNYKF